MSLAEEVRPVRLEVPEVDLDDLRERLRRARFPEPETVTRAGGEPDWNQGPPLDYVTELVRYWTLSYDWRRWKGKLNDRGQAFTEINGLDIHFLHVRSPQQGLGSITW